MRECRLPEGFRRSRFVSHRGLVSWSGGVAAGVAIAAGFGLHGRAQPAALFAPTALTAADYARAEKMLGPATNALVVNAAIRPTWASDTQFTYRNAKADGSGDPILSTRPRRRGRYARQRAARA